MSLDAFFREVAPMLWQGRAAAAVTEAIGPSPSGDAALGFYGVLVARNLEKILREVFPSLKALAMQEGSARWTDLVRDFARAHPPRGRDPNGFGLALPAYLSGRSDVPRFWVEIADFHLAQVHVYHAPEPTGGDGFEGRILVRSYEHAVVQIVDALAHEPMRPPSLGAPCVVVIYRHARTGRARVLSPHAAQVAALARRQGLELPSVLAALEPSVIDAAEQALVAAGVLLEARDQENFACYDRSSTGP